MAMTRRFVNIVAENYRSGVYSLHRLEVSKHLFYPSTPPQAQANAGGGDEPEPTILERLQELPAPWFRIQPGPATVLPESRAMMDIFGLVSPRKNESRIIFVNKAGHSLLVDGDHADANAIRRMPTIKDDKRRLPIFISVAPPPPDAAQDQLEEEDEEEEEEEHLYIMTRKATRHLPGYRSCFDVLKLGGGVSGEPEQWQSLPPPPFVDDPRYDDKFAPAIVRSHAVVDGGRTICVSFVDNNGGGVGTYCFDTAQRAWRRVGDWSLPIHGCAEYVPHLNLWVGFSRETPQEHMGWTSKLLSVGMPMEQEQPPELQHVWRVLVTPEYWLPVSMPTLVNLGSGRFCTTRFFEIKRKGWNTCYSYGYYPEPDIEVAVLTGIEICRGKQGPEVLKHKSMVYRFGDDAIRWVL